MTQKTLILINKAKRLSKAVEIHLQQIKQHENYPSTQKIQNNICYPRLENMDKHINRTNRN